MFLTRKQLFTFSKGPWCIKANGGRYNEARLSREFSAVDVAPFSDSQIPGRFISSSKLRNATKELASCEGYPPLDTLHQNRKNKIHN